MAKRRKSKIRGSKYPSLQSRPVATTELGSILSPRVQQLRQDMEDRYQQLLVRERRVRDRELSLDTQIYNDYDGTPAAKKSGGRSEKFEPDLTTKPIRKFRFAR